MGKNKKKKAKVIVCVLSNPGLWVRALSTLEGALLTHGPGKADAAAKRDHAVDLSALAAAELQRVPRPYLLPILPKRE